MNKNMKKIYRYILLLTLACTPVLYSCDDDVVDLKPVDRVTEETAFDTKKRCELAIVGVYRAANSGIYYGTTSTRRGYPFGAASIIQSEMRGEDMVNNASFYDFTYSSTYSMVTANNSTMWENSFACINKANLVIEGLTKAVGTGVLTQEEANVGIAECRFLRALTYHNMLIHFARPYGETADASHPGLPIHTQGYSSVSGVEEGKKIGRSTVAQCYTFILEDLNYAEANLTVKNATNAITRASKGAAIALKTRVYQHMGKWPQVITEAQKIVSGTPYASPIGAYTLESDPSTPFIAYSNNKESIFSIENSEEANASVNGSLSQMLSTRQGARALVSLSPILYNASFFAKDDKRRTSLLMLQTSSNVWYLDKYRSTTSMSDYAPIIRYAEVLLNYAEADARVNGVDALSLNLLNAVRMRSTTTYASFASKKDLIQAILNERRVEFMGEGRRWEDIHRLALDLDFTTGGIPAKSSYTQELSLMKSGVKVFDPASGTIDSRLISVNKLIPYSDKRFVWPIPASETSRNPLLEEQQNPGW